MTKNTKLLVATAAMTGLIAGSAARSFSAAPVCTDQSLARKMSPDSKAGLSAAADDKDKDKAKHDCKGKNDCKGQGGCKTGDNGCKGKNSCKGKGGCSTKDEKPSDKK